MNTPAENDTKVQIYFHFAKSVWQFVGWDWGKDFFDGACRIYPNGEGIPDGKKSNRRKRVCSECLEIRLLQERFVTFPTNSLPLTFIF